MEKSIIIKLRQSEATETDSNGSYSVTLKDPVTIEQGDIVKVHTVVLDTATESVVNVEEDLQIQMTTARYVRNYRETLPFEFVVNPTQTPNAAGVAHPLPSLRNAWVCTRDKSQGDNFFVECVVMRTGSTNIFGSFGKNVVVHFEYFDPDTGAKVKEGWPVLMPSVAIRKHFNSGVRVDVKKRVRGRYFKCELTMDQLYDQTKITEFTQEQLLPQAPAPAPTGESAQPSLTSGLASSICWGVGDAGVPGGSLSNFPDAIRLFTEQLVFKLPASTYTPTELAQIVNENMTRLDTLGPTNYNGATKAVGLPPNGKFLVDNPFLTTVAQLRQKIVFNNTASETETGMTFSPGNTSKTANQPGFLNDYIMDVKDLDTAFVQNAQDRWVGASQCSMNFDTNLKKLNFDALHFPAYSPSAATAVNVVPGVDYSNPNGTEFLKPRPNPSGGAADPLVPTQPQANYGGVGFTNLTAFVIDKEVTDPVTGKVTTTLGERSPFWQTLGFDTSALLTVNEQSTQVAVNDSESIYPLQVIADLGVNIVGADATIDGLVRKSVGPSPADPIGLPFVGFIANDLTTPILSTRTFDQVANDEGYYMLDIRMKFPQRMIGGSNNNDTETNSNAIQSIIGKYFTSGNFLQSQGTGEIIYTHVGEPQLLNDLNVRVLHPDFSVPKNHELGKKNSIFLEIVKPALPPLPVQPKKKV